MLLYLLTLVKRGWHRLYIEIDPSLRAIPQIALKSKRGSNVFSRSEMLVYTEAKALLVAMEERVVEYQKILETQIIQMIEDKEMALNEYIDSAYKNFLTELEVKQSEWYDGASQKLEVFLGRQEENLGVIKEEIKASIATELTSRLGKITQSEAIISHLVDALHTELDDIGKVHNVEIIQQEGSTILTIENEDTVISMNTESLLSELQGSLEKI